MGKKPWTTTDQGQWLLALIPTFRRAQRDKKTTSFFESTYSQWHDKWPATNPTQDEIDAAGGNIDTALASNQTATETRIKTWFNNHSRGSSSGSGTRAVLDLSPPTKLVQPWQAYLNKYQNTKLKPAIDDAWDEYLKEAPDGVKPQKTKFEIRNYVARKLFAKETTAVKQEVEEHRQKMMSGEETSDVVKRNESFQSSIDKLPRTLDVATESIAEKTGWHVFVIAGGPNPRTGGEITTMSVHQGTTADGKTFQTFLGNDKFDKKIVSKFDEFLHEAFDDKECGARSLDVQSVRDSARPEPSQNDTSSDSDSEYNGRTNKKSKSRAKSSMSQAKSEGELEMERARAKRIQKNIARNKKMLLSLQETGRVDRKYLQDFDVESSENEESEECERPNPDFHTKRTTDSPDSQSSPSSMTRSPTAVDTTEATTLTTKHSADKTSRNASPGASENDGTQFPSAIVSPTANTTAPTTLAASIDNVCCDKGSGTSENVGAQFSSGTVSPTADTTASTTLAASTNNACRVVDSGTSENAVAQVPSTTESPTAGAVSASLAAPFVDNACHDAGSGASEDRIQSPQDTRVSATIAPGEGMSSVPVDNVTASVSDSSCMNTWFAPWLKHFRSASNSASWNALLTKWAEYELLNPPDGRLPTAARPEEVHWWIKRKKLINLLPNIAKPSEFGVAWMAWWVNMQPAWRGQESLVKTSPADGDWEPILRGGSNGLSMVVAALSWWVSAIGPDNQHGLELLAAIEDVSWVLSELVALLSAASMETGKKHSLEDAGQEKPKSKRELADLKLPYNKYIFYHFK